MTLQRFTAFLSFCSLPLLGCTANLSNLAAQIVAANSDPASNTAVVLSTAWTGTKTIGGSTYSGTQGLKAAGVVIAPDNSMYVASNIASGDSTGATLTGGTEVLLKKIDAFGNVLWTKRISPTPSDGSISKLEAKQIILDPSTGNLWVLANYTLLSGGGATVNRQLIRAAQSVVLQSYSPAGAVLLTKVYDPNAIQSSEDYQYHANATGNGFGLDASGNVYVTGQITGTFESYDQPHQSNGIYFPRWMYVLKFVGATGVTTWCNYLGNNVDGRLLAVDASDPAHTLITAVGNTSGIMFWESLLTIGNTQFVAAQMDTSGNITWAVTDGGFATYATALAVDSAHHIYIAGTYTYGYGNPNHLATLPSIGGANGNSFTDVFVERFTPSLGASVSAPATSGNWQFGATMPTIAPSKDWTQGFGLAGASSAPTQLSIGSDQKLYLSGTSTGTLGLLSAGAGTNAHAFVASLDLVPTTPPGFVLKQEITNGGGTSSAVGTSVDSNGSLFVIGTTSQAINGTAAAPVSDVFISKYNSSGVLQ